MDKQIQKILGELYDIDPKMEQYEKQLVGVIQKLLAEKPDTKFDKAFAARLRKELLAGMAPQEKMSFWMRSKLVYGLGGAVIATVLVVPLALTLVPGIAPQSLVTDAGIDVSPRITVLGEQAFGPLGDVVEEGFAADAVAFNQTAPAVDGEEVSIARPLSGGGGLGSAAGISALPTRLMIGEDAYIPEPYPYEITEINYVYQGDGISLEQDKLEVLRRNVKPANVGGLAAQFGLGLVDLNKLGRLQFESVSLQTADQTMRAHIDLTNGELFIHNNAGFGEFDVERAVSSVIAEPYRPLSADDMLPDEEIIKIATDFVKKLNVNLEGYGEPRLQEEYYAQLELAQTQPAYYLPETVSVVYPLIINGTPVYEQNGVSYGIMAHVNVRTKQVASLTGLSVQQYDASLYTVETDIEKLLSRFTDRQGFYPPEATVTTVDVPLGTPDLIFTQMYHYDQQNGHSRLLVPAYRFKVLEKPENQPWFQSYLVVPLVTSLFESGSGPIRIMQGQTEPAVMVEPPVEATTPSVEALPPAVDVEE